MTSQAPALALGLTDITVLVTNSFRNDIVRTYLTLRGNLSSFDDTFSVLGFQVIVVASWEL